MKPHAVASFITLAGVGGFVGIVIWLQLVQPKYSVANQFMSELALGEQGGLMLYAFLSIAVAVAGCAGLLAGRGASAAIVALLATAAVLLAGAGIFSLGVALTLHVVLVTLAFALLVLAMVLTPLLVQALQTLHAKAACWGLGLGTALAVGLGNSILPVGIAQRLAAGCILGWMCWLALYVSKRDAVKSP